MGLDDDLPTWSDREDAGGADFTRIDGIGRTTAAQLRAMGLRTFADLAAMSAEDLVARWEGKGRPTAARIRKDGWLEQSSQLSEEEVPDGGKSGGPTRRRFTVELRIDASTGGVRATRVAAVDGDAAQAWAGWQPRRLLEFLAQGLPEAAPSEEPGGADAADEATEVAGEAVDGAGEDEAGDGEPQVPHAFAVLTAPGNWAGRSAVTATVRIDPSVLALPPGQRVAVVVDVCGRTPSGVNSQLLLSSRHDLDRDRQAVLDLPVVLPEGPPLNVFAALRVVVQHSTGMPRVQIPGSELSVAATG